MLGPCLRIDRGRVGKELDVAMGVFVGIDIRIGVVSVAAERMVVFGFLEGSVFVEILWMLLH